MEQEFENMNKLNFKEEVEKFTDHIDSLYQTAPMVDLILKVTQFASEKKRNEYVKEKAVKSKDKEGNEITKIDIQHLNKYLDLEKKASNSQLAQKIMQRNFIVSLVSQFDAYIGSLIRKIFIIQPELLNSSEKNLSFAKLSEFESIDEAKEHIIEKEIEGVLRESHSAQFKWLENKLGMSLNKDLLSWQNFIEITERRNLFVHTNGVVSSQYISNCAKHKVEFETIVTSGQVLDVDEKYIKLAYCCLYEIGVKLSQVIWRKLLPETIEDADSSLNSIIYNLLQRKEYKLAINLSDFATNILKKHSSQEFKLIFAVNKAQSYKWDGQNKICTEMMNNMDWSSMSDKFKLSKAVLIDDFNTAYRIMRKIGKDEEEMQQLGYQEWPLFQRIREEDQFKKVYKEIYGVDYEFIKYDDDYLSKFGITEDENGNKKKIPPIKALNNSEESILKKVVSPKKKNVRKTK